MQRTVVLLLGVTGCNRTCPLEHADDLEASTDLRRCDTDDDCVAVLACRCSAGLYVAVAEGRVDATFRRFKPCCPDYEGTLLGCDPVGPPGSSSCVEGLCTFDSDDGDTWVTTL